MAGKRLVGGRLIAGQWLVGGRLLAGYAGCGVLLPG